MPLKLIDRREGKAVEFADPKKIRRQQQPLKKRQMFNYVWHSCKWIEKTNQVSTEGIVYRCTKLNLLSYTTTIEKVFDCVQCEEYQYWLKRHRPQWKEMEEKTLGGEIENADS